MGGIRKTYVLFLFAAGVLCSSTTLNSQYFKESYAVLIAVDNYQHPSKWTHLDYPETDAKAFAHFLADQGFHVKQFYGPTARKQAVLSYMTDTLAHKIGTDDRVLFFFAGHGYTETLGGRKVGYIVPYDGESSSSLISMDELMDESRNMGNARHQLFLLDSCFGGLLLRTRGETGNGSMPRYIDQFSERVAREALTAGGENDQVLDSGPNGHSVFMGAILEALRDGKADAHGDGYITFDELADYVVHKASNRYQTPASGKLPGDGDESGEFWFRSPKGASGVAQSKTATAAQKVRSGTVLPDPIRNLAKLGWKVRTAESETSVDDHCRAEVCWTLECFRCSADVIDRSGPEITRITDPMSLTLSRCTGASVGSLWVVNGGIVSLTIQLSENLKDVSAISRFHGLAKLRIALDHKVTDALVPVLPESLRDVDFEETSVGDETIRKLPRNLKKLSLWGTKVTDEGLRNLPPNLSDLSLDATAITDAGILLLPRGLTTLSLSFTRITDEGVKNVPTNLQRLDLSGTKITDAAIALLPANVRTVSVRQTGLTEKCIHSLRPNQMLEDLNGSNYTAAGKFPMVPSAPIINSAVVK